jgi:hypothetical protein
VSATLEDQVLQDRMADQLLVYEPKIAARWGKALSFKDWLIADIIKARVSCHCFCSYMTKLYPKTQLQMTVTPLRAHGGRLYANAMHVNRNLREYD